VLRVIPLTKVQKRYLLLVNELRLTFAKTGSQSQELGEKGGHICGGSSRFVNYPGYSRWRVYLD
jgi:hypothetical protein